MKIQSASITPRKSNQLKNLNTVRRESGNITTQPGKIDKVITFVVKAGMNIIANNLYI